MERKIVAFSESFFMTMFWVIVVLAAAGFLFHQATSRGLFPGFFQWVARYTNLQAQAGA